MTLHVSNTCAHHQEVKIALHSLWCHHTYRRPSRARVERGLSQPVHRPGQARPIHYHMTVLCQNRPPVSIDCILPALLH